MASKKARQTVKQLATKGDVKSARILAKEVVRSDKQKDRLSVSKARLGSIGTQLSQQIGYFVFSLCQFPSLIFVNSHDQSNRVATEIHRNHEVIQQPRKTSAYQPNNARNEYGNDKGRRLYNASIRRLINPRRLESWKKC